MFRKIMIILLIFYSVFALHSNSMALNSKAWKVYEENKLKEKRAEERRKFIKKVKKVFRTILLLYSKPHC